MKKKRKKNTITVTLRTSSKIVTTWYYHEQRFSLSYCQLYFWTVCKYSFSMHMKFCKNLAVRKSIWWLT